MHLTASTCSTVAQASGYGRLNEIAYTGSKPAKFHKETNWSIKLC